MEEILDRIASLYLQSTDAPFDSTAVHTISRQGCFRRDRERKRAVLPELHTVRLSSNGALYGCLSSARSSNIRDLLAPDDQAKAALHKVLLGALADKQSENFQGEVTVMKFIGG